jgi:hypothetical protein
LAAAYGQLECVRLLLERGADKDAKNNVRAHTRATAAARCVGTRRYSGLLALFCLLLQRCFSLRHFYSPPLC